MHRRVRFWFSVAACVAVVPAPISSQTDHIFRITASDCAHGQNRVLTGFRDRALNGIVTALHGVVGCTSIVAVIPGVPPRSYPVDVRRVDVLNDLALLGSPAMDSEPATGLNAVGGTPSGALRVVGYPHALPSALTTRAALRDPASITLNELLPSGLAHDGVFRTRQSPHPRITVLSVEGHLTLGYSGAPLLDTNDGVVGVANGGLASGALEISWAVPYGVGRVNWQTVAAAAPQLARLKLLDSELVFSFATETPRLSPVQCFGLDLDHVRSATIGELAQTSDDPLTYSHILNYYQLNDSRAVFDLFRDTESRVTLVVPRGWRVTNTSGDCHLHPPARELVGIPRFTVDLRLQTLQSSNPVAEIMGRVDQHVQQEFFQNGYSVDPGASNWVPRVAIHRGIVARRLTYVKIDRFCWNMGLLPVEPDNKPNGAPDPQMFNNTPFCPGGAVYPDLWMMQGMAVHPGYFNGSGFGSFMGSDEYVLMATLRAEGATFGADMANCVWRLQESQECRRMYRGQRLYALGVLAATVSTLAPAERR